MHKNQKKRCKKYVIGTATSTIARSHRKSSADGAAVLYKLPAKARVAFGEVTYDAGIDGVTGSRHQLHQDGNNSILIDCGLLQGAETSLNGRKYDQQAIDFDIRSVRALLVAPVHIDHVGRIPYLIDAGSSGPIFCPEPSTELLP